MNDRKTPLRSEKPAQLNFRLSNDQYLLFSALTEQYETTKHGLFLAWLERALDEAQLSPSAVKGQLSDAGVARLHRAHIDAIGRENYQKFGVETLAEKQEEAYFNSVDGVLKYREMVINRIQELTQLLFQLGSSEMAKLEQLRKINVPYVVNLPSEYKPVREIGKFFEDKEGLGPLEEFRLHTLNSEILATKLVAALNDDSALKLRQAIQNLRKKNDVSQGLQSEPLEHSSEKE